jgi:hypothetical protein
MSTLAKNLIFIKKNILLLAITHVMFLTAFSQNFHEKLTLKNIELISLYVTDNYHPDQNAVNNACINSCVFVRFKISSSGVIYNLGFTKNTPTFITEAITKAFESSQKQIKLTRSDKRVVNKKVFVLPIGYYYSSGCSITDLKTLGADTSYSSKKQKQLILNKISHQEEGNDAVFHILDFNDKSVDMLNCVILRPVEIGGPIY